MTAIAIVGLTTRFTRSNARSVAERNESIGARAREISVRSGPSRDAVRKALSNLDAGVAPMVVWSANRLPGLSAPDSELGIGCASVPAQALSASHSVGGTS